MRTRPSIPRWLPAVLLGVAAALLLWPSGAGPVRGNPLGEVDNHLWMYWRAGPWGAGADGEPAPAQLPLIDPVHAPVAWLGDALGGAPGAAWALSIFDLLLAFFGGRALARALGLGRGPRAFAGLATAAGPVLGGLLDFFITESATLGAIGLALAAAIDLSRRRAGATARFLGATLLLAASGPYTAVFAALLGLALFALGGPLRRRRLLGPAALSLVLGAPILWPAVGTAARISARFLAVRAHPPAPRPDWAELPVFGADLLTFVLPHLRAVHPSKATYLGLVAVLAALPALRRRDGRWLWAGVLVLLAFAAGHWPTVAGVPLGARGPAALLVAAVPPLGAISHWHRAIAGALPLLAVAAAIGLRPALRRPAGLTLAAALLLADAIAFSPTAWPRPGFSLDPPALLASLPAPGGLVHIPFDNGRRPFAPTPARPYTRWQLAHRRPVSENYEGVDALLVASDLVAALDAACGLSPTLPPHDLPPAARRAVAVPTGPALAADRARLRAWGYRYIVVHRARCPRPAPAIQRGLDALGPPTLTDAETVVWDLAVPP